MGEERFLTMRGGVGVTDLGSMEGGGWTGAGQSDWGDPEIEPWEWQGNQIVGSGGERAVGAVGESKNRHPADDWRTFSPIQTQKWGTNHERRALATNTSAIELAKMPTEPSAYIGTLA